jgi:hypothetical protein
MGKRKRRKDKPVDTGRRRLLKIGAAAGMVMTWLSIIEGAWNLAKDLWSLRPVPVTGTANIVLEPVTAIASGVVRMPGTGQLVTAVYAPRLEVRNV